MSLAMNLSRLWAAIGKETKIILRDREALLILFAMPLAFVLIMSLAMQDAFKAEGGATFPVVINDLDGGRIGKAVVEALSDSSFFEVETVRAPEQIDDDKIKDYFAEGRYKFAIIIPPDTTEGAKERLKSQFSFSEKGENEEVSLRLFSDPTLRSDHGRLVATILNRILQGLESQMLLEQIAGAMGGAKTDEGGAEKGRVFAEIIPGASGANEEPLPTSVQQSVPAYSLFAMFFVVIPLSGTFIRERQEGSFLRLQSMPVSPWIHMIGKVVPFFIINQIQIILMFLVGIYVIPLFGGDSLTLGDSYLGIAMITVSASIAAIGFGLLVAVFSKTTEQATTFGGISVIIFSALGGIMVPKFLMPDFMQQLANISPLSWGLESFFDLFVRKGGVGDILQEFFMLLLFGFICTSIAVWRYHRAVR